MKRFSSTFAMVFAVVCAGNNPLQASPPPDMAVYDYIAKYKDIATSEMFRTGIPASITLAQGIHESNAGQSRLAVDGNNHFGIKCGGDWTGPTISHHDDKHNECFRKYDAAAQSYIDHSDFLVNKPRYAELFTLKANNFYGWAMGLKQAGYATASDYADKLIRTIERYKLNEFDYAMPRTTQPDMLAGNSQGTSREGLMSKAKSGNEPDEAAKAGDAPKSIDFGKLYNEKNGKKQEDKKTIDELIAAGLLSPPKNEDTKRNKPASNGKRKAESDAMIEMPAATAPSNINPSSTQAQWDRQPYPAATPKVRKPYAAAEKPQQSNYPPPAGNYSNGASGSQVSRAEQFYGQRKYRRTQGAYSPPAPIETAPTACPVGNETQRQAVPAEKGKPTPSPETNRIGIGKKRDFEVNRAKCVRYTTETSPTTIAQVYDKSLGSILAYNDLNEGDIFPPNTNIFISPKRNRHFDTEQTHYMKQGETLWDISQRYGIKLSKIRARNGVLEGSEPAVDQVIYLNRRNDGVITLVDAPPHPSHSNIKTHISPNEAKPATPEPSMKLPPNSGAIFSTDEGSETIETLEPQYFTPVTPRQTGSQTPEPATYITVKKGDTLSSLANTHNTSVAELSRLNNLNSPLIIKGQKLRIK